MTRQQLTRTRFVVTAAAALVATHAATIGAGAASARSTRRVVDLQVIPASVVWGSCADVTCALPPGPAFYPGNATTKDGKRFTSDPYQFPQGPLVVPRGSDVRFTNAHVFPHSVVSFATRDRAPLFRSPDPVGAGEQVLIVTRHLNPGVYAYFCSHHSDGMYGQIKVVP